MTPNLARLHSVLRALCELFERTNSTTMINFHVMKRPGVGSPSPLAACWDPEPQNPGMGLAPDRTWNYFSACDFRSDHDEYTTFYANTKSSLNGVVQSLTAEGFASVPDHERQL